MVGLYLFCLGVGGVLLAASFFADAEGPDDVGDPGHAADAGWQQIFSLRNLTYFLFVFGAIGSGLAFLSGGKTGIASFAIALVSGFAIASMVHAVFGYIRRTDSSEVTSDRALVGLPARVTLPVGAGGVGKIELSYGGQRVELLAQPFGTTDTDAEASEIANGSEVVIVEMVAGMALVSRASNNTNQQLTEE